MCVKIFVIDVYCLLIEFVYVGVYEMFWIGEFSEEWIFKYFVQVDDCYQVKFWLCEMIVFVFYNLLKDVLFM